MTISRRRVKSVVLTFIARLLVWGYALLLVIPCYFLIVSAFKSNSEIFGRPFALPTSLSLGQFSDALQQAKLLPSLKSSLLVTAGAQLLTLTLAIPAAYALAQASGRIAQLMERLFALSFLIPAFAALVPTTLLAIELGLFRQRIFLVAFLSATALPLSVILLTQFFRTIPRELVESAKIDGAKLFTIMWRIQLPLIGPGLATVSILNFLSFWNEYLFSLVLIGSDPDTRTVQVALPTLVSTGRTDYGVLLAGTLISLIPVYLMYLIIQRRTRDALLAGALKG